MGTIFGPFDVPRFGAQMEAQARAAQAMAAQRAAMQAVYDADYHSGALGYDIDGECEEIPTRPLLEAPR